MNDCEIIIFLNDALSAKAEGRVHILPVAIHQVVYLADCLPWEVYRIDLTGEGEGRVHMRRAGDDDEEGRERAVRWLSTFWQSNVWHTKEAAQEYTSRYSIAEQAALRRCKTNEDGGNDRP